MPSFKILFLITTLLPFSTSLQFKVSGEKQTYCFAKTINDNDIISFSYIVSAETSEPIKVELKYTIDNKIIYKEDNEEGGSYRSEDGESGGKYELCFYLNNDHKFHISFDFTTLGEGGNIQELAQDKDVQEMGTELKAITGAFTEIENNARHINDRRFRHSKILSKIIKSIDDLTFMKIAVVAILSLLQVFIIRRFFGPDKRVSKVKGAYSTEL